MKLETRCFFESSHRLSSYNGKCNRLHGHGWVVDIKVEGKTSKDNGMVVDFKEIKKIIEKFDHKTLLKINEENLNITKNFPEDWIFWFDFEPTAENLSSYIRAEICSLVKSDKISVKLYETFKPESYSCIEAE